MTTTRDRGDLIRFGGIWLASLISGVGSSLTWFVLGVWVFQETRSATQFTLVMLAGMLPAVLAGPFAGVVIDRFNRRWTMVITDTLAALPTAAVAILLATDRLEVWHICAGAAVGSVCGVFHATAYQAMTPLLIPKEHLGRVNGLMQVSRAAQIAAPLVAGTLIGAVGMVGVLVIDLASFLVAVSALILVRLPASILIPEQRAEMPTLRSDLAYGWRYLRERPGLLWVALTLTGYNFLFGIAGGLVQPLILSFASAAVLGVLMFAGGAGLFAGSLVMGAWGGPKRKIPGMALFTALGGVALILHAPWTSAVIVGIMAAAFLFTLPIVQSGGFTVLQTKIEPSALGRTMGTVNTLTQLAMPAAYLLAGPLAEDVLGPALAEGGALAGSLGAVIGVGAERGIAAMLLVSGVLLLVLAAAMLLIPSLRRVEHDLPDATPEDGAAEKTETGPAAGEKTADGAETGESGEAGERQAPVATS